MNVWYVHFSVSAAADSDVLASTILPETKEWSVSFTLFWGIDISTSFLSFKREREKIQNEKQHKE
jgi:hypothetical protein